MLDYAHDVAKKPDFFMFGEVYDADPVKLSPYVRNSDMNSVLDFTFQSQAVSFAAGNSAKNLQSLFAGDDYYTTPDSSATALPTFLGNHDMGRVGYFLNSTDAPLQRDELAHELLFLTRGQPVVYYGDEQGFAGSGGDKDARQTLFASEVADYQNQQLVTGETAGSVDRFDTDAPLYAHISELAALRAAHPALATGAQIERYVDNGAGVYAFSRVDRAEQVEYLVAANNSSAEKTVDVSTLTKGGVFDVLYRSAGSDGPGVTADADGVASVTVPALGTVVLKADRTVSAPDAASAISVATPAAGAGVTGVTPVAADVDDATWQETSFAWRVAGDDEWQALGTAEDTSPRVFHDTAGLANGTLIEYRAVSTDAAGNRSAASTYASRRQRREPRRRGGARAADRPRDGARQPQLRDGLRGRLGSRLRGREAHAARRRHLRGHLRRARGRLRVQGRAQRQLGRQLRRERRARWRQHHLHPRRRTDHVLLEPDHQGRLVHRRRPHGDAARQLPVRGRMPRRLAARMPRLAHAGRRQGRRLHVVDVVHSRRLLRGEGRARRQVGRELRRRRRTRRGELHVHRDHRQARRVPLHARDARARDHRHRPAARRLGPGACALGE